MRRAATVLTLLLLAACGSEEAGDPGAEPSAAPESAPTSATTSAPATEAPWEVLDGPLSRCGPQPRTLGGVGLRHQVLRDPEVGRLPAVTAGTGRTVAVLLHQTDGNGLCGWLEHVPALTADPGVAVLAIDLCGYGEAACRPGAAETDPVALAVTHARTRMDAQRVVVVGASMGGAVGLVAASTLDGLDAAVDLSGPVNWPGSDAVRDGRALRVPVLVAMADSEGPEQVEGAQRIVDNAPAGSRFVPAAAGHGYDLVEPLGPDVLAWVVGD